MLTRELQLLRVVTNSALAHLALPDLLRELLKRIQSLMEVDDVAISLLEKDGQQLLLYAAHGPDEAGGGRFRIPLGQGVTGRIGRG
jgi:signal transduction protein with GAF and PtsI domain